MKAKGNTNNQSAHNDLSGFTTCASTGGNGQVAVYGRVTGCVAWEPYKRYNLPKHYVINRNVVMLQWSKEDKTILKLTEDDEFNLRMGFLIAYFQHTSGLTKSKANKYLDALVETPTPVKKIKMPDYLYTND